ncbi:MAG: RsmE family RNA methyltransferase [Vampirovibrionales bacterium]|nr:RsmE family RNA methyltransferase [Vampirovibrionales bacterium]
MTEAITAPNTIKRHRSARFVLPKDIIIPPLPASITIVEPTIAHHAATVLRLKPNTHLTLIHTSLETSYLAKVLDISTKSLTLEIVSQDDAVSDGLPHITIMAALIKGPRWDWLLQKTTELGVRTIQPIITQRTVVKTEEWQNKLPRWQDITRAAVEQCDGRFLPTILEPSPLNQATKGITNDTLNLVMMERGEGRISIAQALGVQRSTKGALPEAVCIVVGPEGGLTTEELESLVSQGFQAIHYGRRILKAETAAIACLSGIVAIYDEGHDEGTLS